MKASSGVMLVQVGDLHIGADWVPIDPLQSLSATVDVVRQLDREVDAVLALSDLAEHGTAIEYGQAREELARLEAPVHVAMGNRDDRETLRHQFGLDAADGAPLEYAADVGPARLLVVDTTIPGHDPGRLDAESLGWLEHQLASFPDTPTVLAMHHPPLLTGSPAGTASPCPHTRDASSHRYCTATLRSSRSLARTSTDRWWRSSPRALL